MPTKTITTQKYQAFYIDYAATAPDDGNLIISNGNDDSSTSTLP
jgi:hypothetical protein